MAANRIFRLGPLALTTVTTVNLCNPPTATGGTNGGSSAQYIILKHIRVLNKTSGAANFSLWLGATGANAAGTEVVGTGVNVAANSYVDYYGSLRIDAADFLVGGASANTTLVLSAEGEIGVSG